LNTKFWKISISADKAIFLLITVIFIKYTIRAYDVHPNSDERASLVIALGKHPSLIDKKGNPITFDAYIDSLNYQRYPVSESSFNGAVHSVLKDNSNGLLYYLMLTSWIKIFGVNIFISRLLTIFFSIVNLLLVVRLSNLMGIRKWFCFLLLLLLVVNPIFVEDAILIRSYMPALTGCLISACYLYEISIFERAPLRYYIYYFLGFIIAFWCHYFTISLLGGMTVFLLWKKRKSCTWQLFLGYFILLLFAFAWFVYTITRASSSVHFFNSRLNTLSMGTGYAINIKNAVRQLLFFSANMFGLAASSKMIGMFLKIIAGSLLCALAASVYVRNKKNFSSSFIIMLTYVPLFFYLMQSILSGNFFNFIPHYLVCFIPFWCLLLIFSIDIISSNTSYRSL
jgi:uncharacterized membrane protein